MSKWRSLSTGRGPSGGFRFVTIRLGAIRLGSRLRLYPDLSDRLADVSHHATSSLDWKFPTATSTVGYASSIRFARQGSPTHRWVMRACEAR